MFCEQVRVVPHLLQRPGLVHARARQRADQQRVQLELRDLRRQRRPHLRRVQRHLAPRILEQEQTAAERRSLPGAELPAQLRPEQSSRAFILDDADADGTTDPDAEPIVARHEVQREVDHHRRLAGAAVAVEHHVRVLGDQHVLV